MCRGSLELDACTCVSTTSSSSADNRPMSRWSSQCSWGETPRQQVTVAGAKAGTANTRANSWRTSSVVAQPARTERGVCAADAAVAIPLPARPCATASLEAGVGHLPERLFETLALRHRCNQR